MAFKLWSELNDDIKKTLKPDLGYRAWDNISEDEKKRIWRFLETYFFNEKIEGRIPFSNSEPYYEFTGSNQDELRKRINYSIQYMNHLYKVKNFTPKYLEEGTHFAACQDFYDIFINREGNAVLDLISLYCEAIINERNDTYYPIKQSDESQEEYDLKKRKWQYEIFDEFAIAINDVFGDFGINVYLTQNGFIPKQDEKIIVDIYEPVMKSIGGDKWKKVNQLLSDAYTKFRENTPGGYSNCVTHTVAAVETFLQIAVKDKPGEGDFAGLISEGQRKGLIPNDMFTRDVFKTLISILMKERKETGDAHVKESYATERNAKMVLNLAMIFIQHCILI